MWYDLMIEIEFLQDEKNEFTNCCDKVKTTSANKDDISPLNFVALKYSKAIVGVLKILF